MIAIVTEEKILRSYYHKHFQRKAQRCLAGGLVLTYVGLVLACVTGLQDDLRNITIPGAQIAVVMLIVGFVFLGRSVIFDLRSYDKPER